MPQGRGAKRVSPKQVGGEGGIRTHDTVTRMPHFECGAFNRSHLSAAEGAQAPLGGRYVTNTAEPDKRRRVRVAARWMLGFWLRRAL